jgi:hypothetical protein
VNGRTALRTIGLAIAVAFVLAAVFQLLDRLNVVAQPPDPPESANLVERVEAFFPYRRSIWPVFFASNAFLGLGFLLIVPLGYVLAARIALNDVRRSLLLSTFVPAGIIGAVAQAMLLGGVKATIDIPYCDCGFKNEEIVSQVWAGMLSQGAATMILDTAALVAAAALVVAARTLAGRAMPATWGWLSYVTAALLVLIVIVPFVELGPPELADWLSLAGIGIFVPIWAAWLGLRFADPDERAAPAAPAA